MNVLDFVNSKDIRDYLKKIDYRCNPLEASWLIYQSRNNTIEEKMEAWKWLIDNTDDCEVPDRINCTYRKSLHDTLREYMDMIEIRIARFYEEGKNVAYSYRYIFPGCKIWTEGENLFSSPEICWDCIEDELDEDEFSSLSKVIITKNVIDMGSASVSIHFNSRKKIMGVQDISIDDEESDLSCFFFAGMWFNFPVPFKKGDVVVKFDEQKYSGQGFNEGPFVLDNIIPWYIESLDSKGKDNYISGIKGDVTDMNAWGYFQDENGRIYNKVIFNYMDLELYKGPYNGNRRLLKALSNYIKGKINIELLLAAYEYITHSNSASFEIYKKMYSEGELIFSSIKD